MMLARKEIDESDIIEEQNAIRFFQSSILQIPDIEEYVGDLPVSVANALASAWPTSDGWKVSEDTAKTLRRYHLVDIRKAYLSGFGEKCRAFLISME